MEDDATTVALGSDEAFESELDAHLGGEQPVGDRADRPATDLEAHLANAADLGDLRFVAQADVEGGQAGRREPERRALDDLRRQRQPIGQADAS